MAVAAKPKPLPKTVALLLVRPGEEPKSGCLWCPLFCLASDFSRYATKYQRNAEKIQGALKEPHAIKRRMLSEAWTPVDILIVGDAPGALEESSGKPFQGKAGQLLRRTVDGLLEENKLQAQVGYTYVTRCRTPLNRDPSKYEQQSCAPELFREIQARKPKVILACGNVPLSVLTGQTGVLALCGRVIPSQISARVVACVQPSYVLRSDHEFDRLAGAVGTAIDVVTGEYVEEAGKGKYHVLSSLSEVCRVFDDFRKANTPVAFDTETGALTPFQDQFPKLLCFSFSNQEGVGYTIPFDHAESRWREGGERASERPALAKLLCDFFADESVVKVAQNEKFDRQHIRAALGVEPGGIVYDTMLTHLTIDDRRGVHGLDILAHTFTGMGGYHKPLDDYIKVNKEADPRKGGSYANIPAALLFEYAAMDADATIRAYHAMVNDPQFVKNRKLQALARHFFPALSATLADLEYRGAKVDVGIIRRMEGELTAQRDALVDKVQKLPKVRQYELDQAKRGKHGKRKSELFTFNPGSDAQVRAVLFGYYGLRPAEMTTGGFKILTARYARLNREANKATEEDANVQEKVSLQAVVDDAIEKREWGHFSVKSDVLHEYEAAGNDLAALILEYRECAKMLGTYVLPVYARLDAQGCVHGTFSPAGTATGRLSSFDPNLQNQPLPAREAYVSRFDRHGVILQADYSQIELRVAGSLFNDPVLINAYLNGDDVHTQTALALSGLSPQQYKALPSEKRKEWRVMAKRINFGILYGMAAPGIVLALKREGVFVSLEFAEGLLAKYRDSRPVLMREMEKLQRQLQRDGQLVSFTGRIRRLPEVFSTDRALVSRALRQCVNYPVQSGAADITLLALILLNRLLKEEGFESIPILTVHDSIVFDCKVDEALDVARIAKYVMENVHELSDAVLPGIDWRWLKVPIVAEFEIGLNWLKGVEFNPDALLDGTVTIPKDWAADMQAAGKSPDTLYTSAGGRFSYRPPRNADELWALVEAKACA